MSEQTDIWYFAYEDDIETIDGPHETLEAAIEAAKLCYDESSSMGNSSIDNSSMLVLKVAARLKMTVAVEFTEV